MTSPGVTTQPEASSTAPDARPAGPAAATRPSAAQTTSPPGTAAPTPSHTSSAPRTVNTRMIQPAAGRDGEHVHGVVGTGAARAAWYPRKTSPAVAEHERQSMSGNATQRYANTAVLSVCGVDAPHVVSSAEFDERLAATYRRVGLRPGLLENLAGVTERRWWPRDVGFADAAAMAGAKALAEAGVDPAQVGLLVDTSVSRAHLEPSAACAVHHALGLPSSALNFDVANACLGFLNGMQLAAMMIDAGRIDYALVVDGEGSREIHENTLGRLERPDATREDVLTQFATLTLGSGAAAMVLGRADAASRRATG